MGTVASIAGRVGPPGTFLARSLFCFGQALSPEGGREPLRKGGARKIVRLLAAEGLPHIGPLSMQSAAPKRDCEETLMTLPPSFKLFGQFFGLREPPQPLVVGIRRYTSRTWGSIN